MSKKPYEDRYVDPTDKIQPGATRIAMHSPGFAWMESERGFRANNFPLADWAFFSAWRLDHNGDPCPEMAVGQDATGLQDEFSGNGYLDYQIALIPAEEDPEKWKQALRQSVLAAIKPSERGLPGDVRHGGSDIAAALWHLPNGRVAFGVIVGGMDFDFSFLDEELDKLGLSNPDWNDGDPNDWVLFGCEFTLGDEVVEDCAHPLTEQLQELFAWRAAMEDKEEIMAGLAGVESPNSNNAAPNRKPPRV